MDVVGAQVRAIDGGDIMQDEARAPIPWDIRREGRAWNREEYRPRADALLELKFEVSKGRLFWDEETRLLVLAMLLENVGIDAAVRLGDPLRWREAVAALSAR